MNKIHLEQIEKILANGKNDAKYFQKYQKPKFCRILKILLSTNPATQKNKNARTISPFIEAGEIAAVLLTKSGNIYVGACREYMMQLNKDSGKIEILADYENRKTVRLKELSKIKLPGNTDKYLQNFRLSCGIRP